MEIRLKAAVDSGNSEHGVYVQDNLFLQPSTYARTKGNPFYDEIPLEYALKKLFDELVVSINSPAVPVGTYYIGKSALTGDLPHNGILLGSDKKYESDVPVIMSIGMLAAVAVKEAYDKNNNLDDKIDVTVDMVTGLPLTEFTQEVGKSFAKRFMEGEHNCRVHLGRKEVTVNLNFEFVKVYPEASPVVFSLTQNNDGSTREGEIFDEFKETYELEEVNGEFFFDKNILHMDIGEGTVDYPITNGFVPNQKFKKGTNNGIGHAIESSLEDYKNRISVPTTQRHNMASVIKNKGNKFHNAAKEIIQDALDHQSQEIMKAAIQQMNSVQNDIDVVVVYGGGSILLKEHLYPKLKETCDQKMVQLLYIPEKYAPTLFVEGLNLIINSDIFEAAKKHETAAAK